MFSQRLSIFAFCFFAATNLHAAEPAKAKTVAASEDHAKLFADIEHLKVNFTQAVHTSLRNKTRMRKGVAYFSKPGSFYWQFKDKETGALAEEYYFDGKTLSHYAPAEKSVTHYGTKSGMQKELQAIVDMVLNAQKLFSQYELVDKKVASNITTIVLKPKEKGTADIKGITVQASESPKYVKEVKIDYTNGNYTQFDFADPATNPIPSSTYKFSNPGGVKEHHIG